MDSRAIGIGRCGFMEEKVMVRGAGIEKSLGRACMIVSKRLTGCIKATGSN